LKRRTLLVY